MVNSRNRHPARRRFLKQAAALSAGAAAGAPLLALAGDEPARPADPLHGEPAGANTAAPAVPAARSGLRR